MNKSHYNPMAHRCHDLTTKGQISPQPNGTPVWNVAIFVFFLVTSSVLGCVPYVTVGTFGLGNHCFQMGFCIGTPPSGAQNQATSFPTNMFILVALRQFKTVRILDKCPFKVGLCIGTPPSSAIPGVCLSAIYAKDVNISTSSMDKQIYIYIYNIYIYIL